MKYASLFFAGLLALALQATLPAQDSARLLSSKGTVMMKADSAAQPVEIKKGDTIPTGATLITQSNTYVLIGLAPGASAIIEPNSTLTLNANQTVKKQDKIEKRTVDLDLKSKTGGVVSVLKRYDRSDLDFKIRTPTGVAAARGTIYRVTGSAFQVLEGNVVVTINGAEYNLGPLQQTDGSGYIVDIDDAELEYLISLIQQAGGSTGSGEDGTPLFDLDLGNEQDQGNPANNIDNNPEPEGESHEFEECEYPEYQESEIQVQFEVNPEPPFCEFED